MPNQPLNESSPRLSTTLLRERRLDQCQACAVPASKTWLTRWQEHDHNDKPERIVVVLCKACSGRLIKSHPRLYREMGTHEPFAGAMHICSDCKWRLVLSCRSPLAQFNGGQGMRLDHPEPSVAFVDGIKDGKRHGWKEVIYPGPVTGCSGKET